MFFLGLLILLISLPLTYSLDPDFGWHLALGRYIHKHHTLVDTLVGYNHFASLSLIDHEWLAHLVGYPIYQLFGYPAFVFLSVLCLWLTVYIAYLDLKRRGFGYRSRVVPLVIFLMGVTVVYGVRLQLLLLLGLVVLRYVGGSDLSFRKRAAAYFAIFLLGNNLHGGYLLLAAVPGCMELERVVRGASGASWKRFAGLMVLILLALCLNPYGLRFWQLTWDYVQDPYYKAHIDEWRPAFSMPFLVMGVGLPILGTAFMALVNRTWKRISWLEAGLLVGFAYLGLAHVRMLPLFLLLVAPYTARGVSQLGSEFSAYRKEIGKCLAGAFFLLGLVMALRVDLGAVRWPGEPKLFPGYPRAAVDASAAYPECRSVANTYEWGGYILGFYSGTQVLMDGRGPQLKVDNETTLFQAFDKIYANPDAAQVVGLLDSYGIRCAIVRKVKPGNVGAVDKFFLGIESIKKRKKDYVPGLESALRGSSQWNMVVEDDLSAVFVRK